MGTSRVLFAGGNRCLPLAPVCCSATLLSIRNSPNNFCSRSFVLVLSNSFSFVPDVSSFSSPRYVMARTHPYDGKARRSSGTLETPLSTRCPLCLRRKFKVGFESFILVDDGTTAVLQGLRVAPWMRGQGVAGLIERFCLANLHSDHPEVKRVRLTRGENPPAAMLKKYKVINSKAVLPLLLPADQLKTALTLLESRVSNVDRSKKLNVLGEEEILKFFEESKTREELLPGGLLVQGWLPLTTHKSNLHLLLNRKIVWMYSHPVESSDSESSSEISTSCSGTQAYLERFLSLGTPPFPVPFAEGIHRLDIDMFGNDPSCAKVHILQQMKVAVQALPPGSGMICVLYVEESLRAEIEQLCEGLTPFHIAREQMILEMET
ncbi:histidine N-acetyltransferase-like isoform X1 [Ranitomeya imitator]|uniref:histidine N-acetyltransferase-like isoform X1 n=1 Tax=Ranitomeya imitator TaxID=111125 RepID=UPI0037E82750